MTREEKIKFICEKFNKKYDDVAEIDDSMIDHIYDIAYYGSK